jgi:hypothetical protein
VNHGVLKLKSINYKIYWEYPVNSEILTVLAITRLGNVKTYILYTFPNESESYNSYVIGPGETLDYVESISPTEDEVYIYEVAIE